MIKAIIEIPKGDSTRRYFNKSVNQFVELGSMKEIIPINDGAMPVDFGYTPDAHNPNNTNALDILVITDEILKVGQEIRVNPIALLRREDGEDKIVSVDEHSTIMSWEQVKESLRNLILSYFGYKSKILVIEDKNEAEAYVNTLKAS